MAANEGDRSDAVPAGPSSEPGTSPSPSNQGDAAAPSANNGSSTTASSGQTQLDYEQLFEEIKTRPCRVDRIEKVNDEPGQKKLRTKPHIIDRELERVYGANTLEEIHQALEEAGRNLQQLQVFRNLHMLVHEAPAVGLRSAG
jgi:outer membrane protein insertion porin family